MSCAPARRCLRQTGRSALLAALLGAASTLHAQDTPGAAPPLRFELTSTTSAAWHGENGDTNRRNDDYAELDERLNLSAARGPWFAGLRIDTTTFISAPDPDLVDRYTPEKIFAGWSGPDLELTAGDAYVSFGRGLSLSLRKLDELGVDTTVRGAKLLVHAGDFGANLVAGYANIQNIDEASGRSVDDPYDLLAGAAGQLTLAPITFGIEASVVAFRESLGLGSEGAYRDRYYQFGPTLDAPRLNDWLGVYLEAIAQLKDTPAPGEDLGAGVYGAATVYTGALTLLGELKAYGDLTPLKPRLSRSEFDSIQYNNPPTLERVQQQLENPQRDIYGGRLRADYRFTPDAFGYVNYALFVDRVGYIDPRDVSAHRPGTIHDPYLGGELRWNESRSRARLTSGVRLLQLDRTGQLVRVDAHAELDLVFAIDDAVSLELHALHDERVRRESPILDQQFREGTIALSARLRPYGSLSGGFDYTTEPSQPKQHYLNATLQWDITPDSSLRLFAGAARGGLKCVSGVCRTMPAFEGVKLVATLRL